MKTRKVFSFHRIKLFKSIFVVVRRRPSSSFVDYRIPIENFSQWTMIAPTDEWRKLSIFFTFFLIRFGNSSHQISCIASRDRLNVQLKFEAQKKRKMRAKEEKSVCRDSLTRRCPCPSWKQKNWKLNNKNFQLCGAARVHTARKQN